MSTPAEDRPAPRDARTLEPRIDPHVARVESAIEQAARRGDFDDLPGAGRPLDLPATHDPDWWIHQRIASGEIDPDALLPVVVLLRKEYDTREETLATLPSERAAREYAEDFTERVHQDRRANPFQKLLAPAWAASDAAARWRELREAQASEASAVPPATDVTEEEQAQGPSRPSPRRWWRVGRRD